MMMRNHNSLYACFHTFVGILFAEYPFYNKGKLRCLYKASDLLKALRRHLIAQNLVIFPFSVKCMVNIHPNCQNSAFFCMCHSVKDDVIIRIGLYDLNGPGSRSHNFLKFFLLTHPGPVYRIGEYCSLCHFCHTMLMNIVQMG